MGRGFFIGLVSIGYQASLVAQSVKNLPTIQETWVWFLGGEDPLEKGMETHSSILAWEIHGERNLASYSPWGHRVRHDWLTQFSSVTQSCLTLCSPMDCSMPGFPVHHQLLEFTQTHVHWVGDTIQPSHSLLSPSHSAFNLSQHQGPFQRVRSLHQVAKLLEFQLQYQSFQWTPRTDFL